MLKRESLKKSSQTFLFGHPKNGVHLCPEGGGTVIVGSRVVHPQDPGLGLDPTEEGSGCPRGVRYLLIDTVGLQKQHFSLLTISGKRWSS